MPVIKRNLPYGTKRPVTVREITTKGRVVTLICDDGKEGYICMYDIGQITLEKVLPGAKGILTLKAGGPLGSYWDFQLLDADVAERYEAPQIGDQ